MPHWEQLDFDSHVVKDSLSEIFEDAFRTVVRKGPTRLSRQSFIRTRGFHRLFVFENGCVYARVSDILRNSPRKVLFSLACILVAKLYRKKASSEHERAYREFASLSSVVSAAENSRKSRGYKITTSPQGTHYNLDQVFGDLNVRYFNDSLIKPTLSWSQTETARTLGHHDHVHDTIVISKSLDSTKIPRWVLEYVVFHEMLHARYPPRVSAGRTSYHGREFRAAEKQFERFEEAVEWLEKLSSSIRRKQRALKRKMAGSKAKGTKTGNRR